jgi:hypothetical protein
LPNNEDHHQLLLTSSAPSSSFLIFFFFVFRFPLPDSDPAPFQIRSSFKSSEKKTNPQEQYYNSLKVGTHKIKHTRMESTRFD